MIWGGVLWGCNKFSELLFSDQFSKAEKSWLITTALHKRFALIFAISGIFRNSHSC